MNKGVTNKPSELSAQPLFKEESLLNPMLALAANNAVNEVAKG